MMHMELSSLSHSKEACRTHWQKMTDMKPRETYIKNRFRRRKQREQLERAFERFQQQQPQSISTVPVATEVVGAESPSILAAILDPSMDSSFLDTTYVDTAAPSYQRFEPLDVPSPPLLTSEGTTPADSVHSVPTTPSEDVLHLGFMPDELKEPKPTPVSSGGVAPRHSSLSAQTTSIKRPAPLEFNESIDASSERVSNGPPIPSVQEELAWTHQNPASGPVRECENRSPDTPTPCLPAVQEETEPEPEKLTARQMTLDEVEDEMKAPRGFINFIKYGLTKSRLSVQSMISASGTIRSRFSSRRSSQQSTMVSDPQEDTHPFCYASYMSIREEPPSIHPPQSYEGGRQATSLFLELRLAGATDENVARRLKELLQDIGPAKARKVVNAQNDSGETALEVALALGNVPACEVLLDAGADVYARTSDGKSLSEFGRMAQSEANNNSQYIAIGACRNAILSHSRPEKSSKFKKANNAKTSTEPPAAIQMPIGSVIAPTPQGESHTITDENPLSPSAPLVGTSPQGVWNFVFDDTTQQQVAFEGANLDEDRSTSRSNSASMSMAISASRFPVPESISSHQTLTPDVPDLLPFFHSASSAQSTGWQPQIFSPSTPGMSHSLRPNTLLWNSYFTPSLDLLPLSASLEGSSGTLDISSILGNAYSSPGIDASKPALGTHSGHFELLPDGRVVHILPIDHPSLARAPSSLGRHFSHRDARVFDTGNSVQLQVPLMSQNQYSLPGMQELGSQRPEFGLNVNPCANLASEAVYSNSLVQRQQYHRDINFPVNNNLQNPPQTSNMSHLGPSDLPGQPSAYLHNDATFNSNKFMPNPEMQHTNLSDMDVEALSFHLMSPTPENPASYGNNFVHSWDSWPTGT
jgi:hypothetical protein